MKKKRKKKKNWNCLFKNIYIVSPSLSFQEQTKRPFSEVISLAHINWLRIGQKHSMFSKTKHSFTVLWCCIGRHLMPVKATIEAIHTLNKHQVVHSLLCNIQSHSFFQSNTCIAISCAIKMGHFFFLIGIFLCTSTHGKVLSLQIYGR